MPACLRVTCIKVGSSFVSLGTSCMGSRVPDSRAENYSSPKEAAIQVSVRKNRFALQWCSHSPCWLALLQLLTCSCRNVPWNRASFRDNDKGCQLWSCPGGWRGCFAPPCQLPTTWTGVLGTLSPLIVTNCPVAWLGTTTSFSLMSWHLYWRKKWGTKWLGQLEHQAASCVPPSKFLCSV